MPVQIPTTIRRALGDEAALDFIPLVEKIIVERAIPRDEYRQVLSRLDILDHDMIDVKAALSALNERFDQMYQHFETLFDRQNRHAETRFDSINQRFDSINQRFDNRFDQINERMLVQTRWMVGTIALFGTLMTVLLAISQFTP